MMRAALIAASVAGLALVGLVVRSQQTTIQGKSLGDVSILPSSTNKPLSIVDGFIDTIYAEVSMKTGITEFNKSNYPRGIRNNNPGNIRHGDRWRGIAAEQPDRSFITFDSPEYGIRAMGKLLVNYERLYGINTVAGLIDRWAPPIENNTQAYINSVAHSLGVSPNEPINVKESLVGLVPAIIKHENGMQPYSEDIINNGLALV